MDSDPARNTERLVRGLFVRALVLFLVLGTIDAVVIGWLYVGYRQRALQGERLVELRRMAGELRQALAEAAGGGEGWESRTRELVAEVVEGYGSRLRSLRFVEVRGPDGQPVFRLAGKGRPMPPPEEAGPFRGLAPDNPDAPPRGLTGDVPGEQGVASGAGIREVVVPLGNYGSLRAVLEDPQQEVIDRMRHDQLLRLAYGGAVSLVLLLVAFLYVLRLVHRTRRLEAATQHARHLAYLGTLASGLAHEIRNPLNAMNINLQMLEEELEDAGVTGESLELLRSSRQEVLRLERLVKDFLAYARPQASGREELSPVELVGDVVRFLRPQFEDRGVRIELESEDGAPTVRIDPGQVRQAMINILQNALEASPPNSTVTVTVGPTDRGEARIEVRDEGKGIPPKDLQHIFEVFWSEKPAGSGLGLPIAQRVVEAHGGRIEVESRPGSGSLFRIVLPPAVAGDASLPEPA